MLCILYIADNFRNQGVSSVCCGCRQETGSAARDHFEVDQGGEFGQVRPAGSAQLPIIIPALMIFRADRRFAVSAVVKRSDSITGR